MSRVEMGIVSAGHYLPPNILTAEEIAEASGTPLWVVRDKFGITQKHYATTDTHPNEMAVYAAKESIDKAGIDPLDIDVLICTTEEWKEYQLWTAGIDLAYEIGARNAWAFDIHMRCATTVSALKLARSLMADDDDIDTVMIAGGYIVSRFIDYTNPHVIVPASGTIKHPTDEAVAEGEFYFDLVEPEAMKSRLNEVSMDNWMHCVDEALRKSGTRPDGAPFTRDDIGYLDMLLVKPSAHRDMLDRLGLTEDQSVYLGHIGHIGEQDTIISLIEGERQGKLHDGDLVAMVGAGIGYVWAAGIVQWGSVEGR
jgi:3-oxoacyl-[acyl-carrier-protein] synthase-3